MRQVNEYLCRRKTQKNKRVHHQRALFGCWRFNKGFFLYFFVSVACLRLIINKNKNVFITLPTAQVKAAERKKNRLIALPFFIVLSCAMGFDGGALSSAFGAY